MATVALSWSHDDTDVAEDEFRIYRDTESPVAATDANRIGTTGADETSFADEIDKAGTYYYAVTAANEFGESDLSNEDSVDAAEADPQVTITATNSPVAAGESLHVDVEVTNAGDLAAGEVTLAVSEQ